MALIERAARREAEMPLRPGNDWTQNALYLARACLVAYRDRKKVKNFPTFRSLKLRAPNLIVTKNDAALIASDDRNVIVAFRGTDNKSDWSDHKLVRFRSTPTGQVHRGLYDAMHKLVGGVQQAMEAHGVRAKDVYFAGHSRGGAIAVLMAQFLWENATSSRKVEFVPDYIYSFGAPRVGNLEFYRSYDLRDRTFLVVNERDPVPHLPPVFRHGYFHVSEQYHLTGFTHSRIDVDETPESVWKALFSGSWAKLRTHGLKLADHSLTKGYIPNLRAIVESLELVEG